MLVRLHHILRQAHFSGRTPIVHCFQIRDHSIRDHSIVILIGLCHMEKRRDGMGGTCTTAVQVIDVELHLRVAAAVFQQCINFIVNSDMEFDWAAVSQQRQRQHWQRNTNME